MVYQLLGEETTGLILDIELKKKMLEEVEKYCMVKATFNEM